MCTLSSPPTSTTTTRNLSSVAGRQRPEIKKETIPAPRLRSFCTRAAHRCDGGPFSLVLRGRVRACAGVSVYGGASLLSSMLHHSQHHPYLLSMWWSRRTASYGRGRSVAVVAAAARRAYAAAIPVRHRPCPSDAAAAAMPPVAAREPSPATHPTSHRLAAIVRCAVTPPP